MGFAARLALIAFILFVVTHTGLTQYQISIIRGCSLIRTSLKFNAMSDSDPELNQLLDNVTIKSGYIGRMKSQSLRKYCANPPQGTSNLGLRQGLSGADCYNRIKMLRVPY
jgi:hypothetical protein